MQIAIVGLDAMYWPPVYAKTVQEETDAELVGYTDLGVDRAAVETNLGTTAAAFGDEYDIPDLGSLDGALDATDAAIVCSRNSRMPALAAQALERGVHAFAAKPVGVDVNDLERVRDALSPETVFSAGRSAHGYPPVRTLLEGCREIGDVHTLRVMHNHGRCREWVPGTWYAEPEEGNGCNYLGWYPLHFAVEVLGPVTEVWGHAQVMPGFGGDCGDWDSPDHCKAQARHENGRLSTIEAYCDVGDWDVGGIEAEVVGTDGVVRYAAPGNEVALHTDDGVEYWSYDADARAAEQNSYDIERWIAACRGEGSPVIDAEEALHVAAVGCAWNQAADADDRHAPVELLP